MTEIQQDLIDKALALGPVWRVFVLRADGKKTYKAPEDLLPSDQIELRVKDGIPIVMRQAANGVSRLDADETEIEEARAAKSAQKTASAQDQKKIEAADIQRKIQSRRKNDPLFKQVSKDAGSSDVLNLALLQLAEQAALLKAMAEVSVEAGDYDHASKYALRTVNSLKSVAEAWLRQKDQLLSTSVDMNSPPARAYIQLIIQTMKKAMDATGVRSEQVDTVMGRFMSLVQDPEWEADAKNRMKNAIGTAV